MKKYAVSIIGLSAIAVLLTLFWTWRTSGPPAAQATVAEFAQCLADKKITMYGSASCPHCQNEKRAFGDAFKYVPYVECPQNIQTCLAVGIRGYPTWIFPDGKRLEGEQGLANLSRESGCPLANH